MARARTDKHFEIAVIGGGATGYGAALSAAKAGFSTVLFAPSARFAPGRTAALFHDSIAMLEDFGLWPDLAANAAPLKSMRLVDATARLIRAREVTFHASEIGLPAFGYNIANADLVEAFQKQAARQARLTIYAEPVHAIEPRKGEVKLAFGKGQKTSVSLVIGADGARSLARRAAGIATRDWDYAQAALVTTLSIEVPHQDISTEFHTETGPFTLVPLAGRRMSLVWVDRPHITDAAVKLAEPDFNAEIERKSRSVFGRMIVDSERAIFPLRAMLAERFAANRIMLVGEAAHVFPPIGAQGLNLGFRDIEALGQILPRLRNDPGEASAIDAYHRARQGDIRSRTFAVDLLNRSLLTSFLPAQALRATALALAGSVPPLRRVLMKQGLAARSQS
ncbi:MAG: UbiH/UbiF family hydroxylase [Alphaproteobacteria bacterium]|nr:MAG: UbiH/UbiF family hydroxylase [Alphaproteobacteria bacterium]